MARTDPMDLLFSFENQGQQALGDLAGLSSGWEGINTTGDLNKRFGIKSSKEMFAPLYKMLEAKRGRSLQAAGLHAGRSASPGMTFSNVEQDYESGLQGLLGAEGQAEQGQSQFLANLLSQGISARDQFGLQKNQLRSNMASNLFGNRLGLEQFNRAGEGPSFGDILGTVLGAGSKVLGSHLGAPKTTYNFDQRA